MDAASGTNGSRIAVSPALAETTARLLTTHRDDVSRHRDATFLTFTCLLLPRLVLERTGQDSSQLLRQ